MSHVLENYGISLVCSRIVEGEESRKNPVQDVDYGISLVCLRICFDYFDYVEVEEPNPGGGILAIRRKGWLAVSFIIKISIRNRSKGSNYQKGSRQLCIGRKSFWMDSVKEDPLKLHTEVRPANSH